jgi:hypothetical protein
MRMVGGMMGFEDREIGLHAADANLCTPQKSIAELEWNYHFDNGVVIFVDRNSGIATQ